MGKNLIKAVLVLLIGLCCIIWPQGTNELIIKLLGVSFICAGLIDLIFALAKRQFSSFSAYAIISLCGTAALLIIGAVIIAKADVMLKILNYIFGAVLLILGISQISGTYSSPVARNVSAYAIPVLVAIIGVLFLCNVMSANVITVVFGVCLVFVAIRDFIYSSAVRKAQKEQLAESERQAERIRMQQNAEDAEIVGEPEATDKP